MDTLTNPRVTTRSHEQKELNRRMQKPQRHRLLHSFPLAAAMPKISEEIRNSGFSFRFSPNSDRVLLVGVLPHSFCNPKVRGCGFCTFSHEKYDSLRATAVVETVIAEIDQRLRKEPSLQGRVVEGLYLGGGTANLTPAPAFRKLCQRLNSSFNLSGAEVTLEGVPIYFLKKQPFLIDIMREELHARHFRISMGVQTFDEQRLKEMGRLAFGTRRVIEQVVREAHRREMTISGDLLFNLPWQTLPEMQRDLHKAVEIGLDHIGLYHLVAFRGLDTEWSKDSSKLAGLPKNEVAAMHWETLRDELFSYGFTQTTLTNFEREKFAGKTERFQYEELSFHPDQYEMLGFGPAGISFATDNHFQSGWKTTNPDVSAEYMQAVNQQPDTANLFFQYSSRDLRIFYLTRRLAGLEIDQDKYAIRFDSELCDDFPEEMDALIAERLLKISNRIVKPTIRGMFYADSIAALFARRRLSAIREYHRHSAGLVPAIPETPFVNDNSRGHM